MEPTSWQIQMIIQMKKQGYNIYEMEEKTGVSYPEIKKILDLK